MKGLKIILALVVLFVLAAGAYYMFFLLGEEVALPEEPEEVKDIDYRDFPNVTFEFDAKNRGEPDMITFDGPLDIEVFGVDTSRESILEGIKNLDFKLSVSGVSERVILRNLDTGTPDIYLDQRVNLFIANYGRRTIWANGQPVPNFEEQYEAELQYLQQIALEIIAFWNGQSDTIVAYDDEFGAIVFYDIVLDPELPDNLFLP